MRLYHNEPVKDRRKLIFTGLGPVLYCVLNPIIDTLSQCTQLLLLLIAPTRKITKIIHSSIKNDIFVWANV
jgi:hypothetical protein